MLAQANVQIIKYLYVMLAQASIQKTGRFPMEKLPCVYILANKRNGTLYIGVTSNLPGRLWKHKNKAFKGFTEKYGVDNLVWYEVHETLESAIQREKAMKFWQRKWKLRVIEEMNPHWRDMYKDIA